MKPEEGQAYGSQIETQQWQQQGRWREEVVFEAELVRKEGSIEEVGIEESSFEESSFEENNAENSGIEEVSFEEIGFEEIRRIPQEQQRAHHSRVEKAKLCEAHVTTFAKRREPRWQEVFAVEALGEGQLRKAVTLPGYKGDVRKRFAQGSHGPIVERFAEINAIAQRRDNCNRAGFSRYTAGEGSADS